LRAANNDAKKATFALDITEDTFTFTRNAAAITAETALDGIYVIRTTVAPSR